MTAKSVLMSLESHQAMVKECEYKSTQLAQVMADRDALASDYAEIQADRDRLQTDLFNARNERDALAAQNGQLNSHFKRMQAFCGKFLAPNGRVGNDEFINQIVFLLDGPEQRAAQAAPGQCLAELRADAIKGAAQRALDAVQVPPAVMSDYFNAGVRCCAASLVEYAEKVRGGAV